MGLFNFLKRKKHKDNKSTNIPKASYDLYNNGETQNINSYENSNLLVAYEETVSKNEKATDDFNEQDTGETQISESKDSEQIQSSAIDSNLPENKIDPSETEESTKNVKKNNSPKKISYYISVKKDKTGKKLGWEVKKGYNLEKLCSSKDEALTYVKTIIEQENQEATCTIRKVDGSIQEKLKFNRK